MACSLQLPARQNGMSMLSTLVVLSVGVFFVLIGIKMVPVYMENLAVGEVLEALAEDNRSRSMSRAQLRDNIMRRLSINGVRDLPKDKIKFNRTRKGMNIAIDYEVRKPVMGNVAIVMAFAESVDIPGND